jgi:hypothetical protein
VGSAPLEHGRRPSRGKAINTKNVVSPVASYQSRANGQTVVKTCTGHPPLCSPVAFQSGSLLETLGANQHDPRRQTHRLIQPSSPGSEPDGDDREIPSLFCFLPASSRPSVQTADGGQSQPCCVIPRLIPSHHPTFPNGSPEKAGPGIPEQCIEAILRDAKERRQFRIQAAVARAAFPDSGRSGRGHRLNQPPCETRDDGGSQASPDLPFRPGA